MNFLKTPFQIGSLSLKSNVLFSPLAGCSDFPYRKMALRYGRPGLFFCEMVKMEPLVRGIDKTLEMLDYSQDMHPIGAQLVGSNVKIAKQAAKRIEEMGFDVVDLNCGCPVDKVTKDGSGSGLLKEPEKIGEIISEMVSGVKIPVTVKIRAGWDHNSINAAQIVPIAEKAGAVAISVHARTRSQGYDGPAHWQWIKDCVAAKKTIKVIGNGDVFSPQAARLLFETTACDAVLCSRGTMGQPWIANDIEHFLKTGELLERTREDYMESLRAHFELEKAYRKQEKQVVISMRRIGCWYAKCVPHAKDFRSKMTRAVSIGEIEDLLRSNTL